MDVPVTRGEFETFRESVDRKIDVIFQDLKSIKSMIQTLCRPSEFSSSREMGIDGPSYIGHHMIAMDDMQSTNVQG